MIEPGKAVEKGSDKAESPIAAPRKLLAAVIFGLAFGFLLQKGGAAKFNVLIGQLLLQDWTVAKIMMSAILVGMIGIYPLHRAAKVNLHLKPTRIAANVVGGLIFGVGFALIGYCPGTAAAALGQGNWDAIFGMLGLVAGSYIYAVMSGWLKETAHKWGEMGKVTIPDLFGLPRGAFVVIFAIVLSICLVALERFTIR